MRIPLLLLTTLIVLTSCSRYQYATINSTNLNLNEHQEFVAENDTLMLLYNFNGENAPVNLLIQNKLNVPVFIDWRQSALIINDKAISYVPNTVPITGGISAERDIVSNNGITPSYSGNFRATATLPVTTTFIPPNSYITKSPMEVTNLMIRHFPDSVKRRIKVPVSDGGFYYIKQAKFTDSSSPIRFRSYLTVMVGEAGAKPVVYEHGFYVSELLTTGLGPDQFGYAKYNEGNRYFIREETGFGKAATGFGVIAGTAVIAGAAAALNPRSGCCNNCQY